ncbi:MAG: J domain-containing protein, partial [Myxococcota bacterium]|nr:J domain-containing protein [Myxococcota bacterium]
MRIGPQSSQADQRVPRLADGCDPTALPLSPSEGYLLSRIDGATSWGVLRQMGGLPAGDVDRCLERWLKDGVIEVDDPGPAAGGRAQPAPSRETAEDAGAAEAGGAGETPAAAPEEAEPAAVDGVEVDASLSLDVGIQRRILGFAARLDRPYHELLGVARDADARTIKKAYFALSRVLHPDRYFRRDIGPFGPLVERCFKKLLEAYELLSDP